MVKYEDDDTIGFLEEHGDIDSLLSDEDEEDMSDYEDIVEVNGIKVPLKHGEVLLGSHKTGQLRKGVKNVEALERALESIAYKVPKGLKRVPWVESLSITSQKTVDDVAATDDVKREGIFQAMTLEMVKDGLRRLDMLKIPFSRPVDYFADMAKSDKHMKKIQGKLAEEQRRMQIVEERKKNKVEKKFAKDKRVEAQKVKKAATKDSIRELDEWKKNRSKGNQGDLTAEESLDAFLSNKDKAKEDRDFKKMVQKKQEVASKRDSMRDSDFKIKAKAGGGTGRSVFGGDHKKATGGDFKRGGGNRRGGKSFSGGRGGKSSGGSRGGKSSGGGRRGGRK